MDEAITQAPFDRYSNYSPPKSARKSRRVVFIIFIVILIGAVGFGGKRFLGSKNEKQDKSNITAVPTKQTESPTDTPAPTDSETPELTVAPTAKPTTNPVDKATGLDRSTVSVEIQNGSGEFGAASKASEVLKTFGYHIIATGNADNFNYENATIKVKSDKSNFLALLKKDLGFNYTIGSSSADLSASSSSDVVVIVGK